MELKEAAGGHKQPVQHGAADERHTAMLVCTIVGVGHQQSIVLWMVRESEDRYCVDLHNNAIAPNYLVKVVEGTEDLS